MQAKLAVGYTVCNNSDLRGRTSYNNEQDVHVIHSLFVYTVRDVTCMSLLLAVRCSLCNLVS